MLHADLEGRTLGELTLGPLLSSGGHGAVYRAEQRTLRREVVVKVLQVARRRDPRARERFLQEARLASSLDHPYAAHVYAFGVEDDGLLWLAMEYVHGVTLHEWLHARGPMPPAQLVPFYEKVAQVVHAAHRLGIVHRDLKPSNVMVIERDGVLLPKLLDFGIAKGPAEGVASLSDDLPDVPQRVPEDTARLQVKPSPFRGEPTPTAPPSAPGLAPAPRPPGQMTASGEGIGSFPYMAPELWTRARHAGPAADVYALGAMAFRLLVGCDPFTATRVDDYRELHAHAPVPPLGDPLRAFEPVIRRAMAKQPAERYASALDLADELTAALRQLDREQLRTAARQWADRRQSPGLLWGPEELHELDHWRRTTTGLSPLECSFVAASQRRARRAIWFRRVVVAAAVLVAAGGLQYRATTRVRIAEQVATATITQAELEQGRAALLHGEAEAVPHLWRAYRRSGSAEAEFMLARAVEPQLAELAVLPSASGRMWSAEFSPDEHQVATADDREVRIWDTRTWHVARALPHGANVYQLAYSADGTRLYTAAADSKVRVWDPASGALVRTLTRPTGPAVQYGRLAISPDGAAVAALDVTGGIAHVWATGSGDLLAELATEARDAPALAFSADGRWLAVTGGADAAAYETRGAWRRVAATRGVRVRRLAFGVAAPMLVTGGDRGEVTTWSLPDGARRLTLHDGGDPVDALAISPDGAAIAAGFRDGVTRVWEAGSGAARGQLNPRGAKVHVLEFDRQSRALLVGGADGATMIVDAAQLLPLATLAGSSAVIWSARFDRSGARVVTAAWDGAARVWSAAPTYRRWTTPGPGARCDMVTTPDVDRRFVAVGCRDQVTEVWDTAEGRLVAKLPAVTRVGGDFTSAFPAVAVTGDRAAIARGRTVEIYALPSGQLLRVVAHPAEVNAVVFSGITRDVLSGGVDGSLILARDDGAQLQLPPASAGIDALTATLDGRLVAADARRRLHVYDRAGVPLGETAIPFRALALRGDGADRVVALSSYLGEAAPPVVVDLRASRLLSTLRGHTGDVFSARWLSSGEVLTAGADGTVRTWEGGTGRPLRTYGEGGHVLSDALVIGGLIVAGSVDGILRFWDQSTGRLVWGLRAHRVQIVGLRAQGDDLITRGITGELTRWRIEGPTSVLRSCESRSDCAIVAQ